MRSRPFPRPPRRRRVFGAALGLGLGLGLLAPGLHVSAAENEAAIIFAAASTMAPLSELAANHERHKGQPLKLSFASSATLARQILNGAQPSLFLSANHGWMDALDDAGLLAAGTRQALLGNQLVVIRRKEPERRIRSADAASLLADPASLLGALGGTPLVLGDPAHVPAGIYAREALERLELWQALRGRLAFAANARAVTVRVARGEAPLGITYASELKSEPRVEAAATIPAYAHSPIRYELALIAPGNNPAAAAFRDYLLSEAARTVFRAHGFTVAAK